jgi:hypothetical protein
MKDIIQLIRDFFNLPLTKRVRFFLYLLQIIFTVFISSELYKYFVGSYKVIPLTNIDALTSEFLLKGTFAICLFFFVSAWYMSYNFVFDFLTLINKLAIKITYLFLRFVAKKIMKISAKEFEIKKEKFFSDRKENETYVSVGKKMGKISIEKQYYTPYLILSIQIQFTIIYFVLFHKKIIPSPILGYCILGFAISYFASFMSAIFVFGIMKRIGEKLSSPINKIQSSNNN